MPVVDDNDITLYTVQRKFFVGFLVTDKCFAMYFHIVLLFAQEP